jgi:hypothetical protein
MQLENIASIVNPDGEIFLLQDILGSSSLEKNINHPFGPFLYTISCMHCMSDSLAHSVYYNYIYDSNRKHTLN